MSVVAVSEREGVFLDDAKRRIAKLAADVESIGERGYLSFGSAWGAKFEPIQAAISQLLDEGYSTLDQGGEARQAFTTTMVELNRAVSKALFEEEGAFDFLTTALTTNPITNLSWYVRTVTDVASSTVEGTAAYAGEAASAAGQALGARLKALFASPYLWLALLGGGALLVASGRKR